MRFVRAIPFLWSRRWNITRLVIALTLLVILAADTPARLARLTLAALPDMDYASEIATLREQGRFAEAIVIADAGLAWTDGPGNGPKRQEIERQRQMTVDEQASWLRRAKDVGWGALSGRGESLEQLIGAIAADMFVVGDIRDLVIQGGTWASGGEPDKLIVALSGVGIVLTVAPEIDWAPALLKVARKAGAVTEGLKDFIVRGVKMRRTEALAGAFGDVTKLATRASPAGAIRILKFADNEKDLAKLAAFAERNGAKGGAALLITGKEGAAMVRAESAVASAVRVTDDVVLAAARKGPAGAKFLASPAARVLTRPHWILGFGKGVWKGNVPNAIAQAARAMDPYGWWLLPLVGVWTLCECGLFVGAGRRALNRRRAETAGPVGAPAAIG
ncbi:MAG: hypothetical protein KF691_02235 [Phycisphaeraceae bacterium]|nr:hypothetical protein [Phycisphaeraceae bacterium]